MCLANANINFAGKYHYQAMPPCAIEPSLFKYEGTTLCSNIAQCLANPLNYSENIFVAKQMNTLIPIGIAKDGFIIYGPYDSFGNLWAPCDIDICNGHFLYGQYTYVSTAFHPYFVGCFGPGSGSNYTQSCSSNPRNCSAPAQVASLIQSSSNDSTTVEKISANPPGPYYYYQNTTTGAVMTLSLQLTPWIVIFLYQMI